MQCTEFQELISRFVDAELEESNHPTMFDHLEGCRDCQRFLAFTLRLREKMRHNMQPDITPAASVQQGTIRDSKPFATIPFWQKKIHLPVPAAIAISAFLLATVPAVSIVIGDRSETTQDGERIDVVAYPTIDIYATKEQNTRTQ